MMSSHYCQNVCASIIIRCYFIASLGRRVQ
uniref:Uncharacterized protein n=1 Tax=Myoviridae sp. ctCdG12 TaxID=2825052 RepID=A0A8S5U2K5_9CAUD|nr:MAG TPA: hypothetical protein [Myoviridae sp. ctCdG12]